MQFLDYIIIFVFQVIGIACGVLNEIRKVRKINPTIPPNSVWKTVKQEDWDTLIGSGIVLILSEAIHLVMDLKGVQPTGMMAAWWFIPAYSLVAGWGGQDILFKWLGTAKQTALDKAGGSKFTTIQESSTPTETKTTVKTETITPKNEQNGD